MYKTKAQDCSLLLSSPHVLQNSVQCLDNKHPGNRYLRYSFSPPLLNRGIVLAWVSSLQMSWLMALVSESWSVEGSKFLSLTSSDGYIATLFESSFCNFSANTDTSDEGFYFLLSLYRQEHQRKTLHKVSLWRQKWASWALQVAAEQPDWQLEIFFLSLNLFCLM